MTAPLNAADKRESVGAKLTTTAATAVYTVPEEATGAVAWSMRCANVDGTNPVDVTIEWFDASANVSYALLSTYALQPDSSHYFDLLGMGLDPEDELRVTASAANDLHVVTVVTEHGR